jgi:hypothetical protein
VINHRLWKELDKVAFRVWRLRFWSALAAAWFLAALVGMIFWMTGLPAGGNARVVASLLCGVAALLAGVCVWLARASKPNYVAIARRIETAFPDLGSCLLAALEQQPSLETGRFGYLQESVIDQALVHADHHPWRDIVSSRRLALAICGQFATFTLFLLSLAAAAFWVSPAASVASTRDKRPGATTDEFSFVVEPGNTEIERGSSLLVLARYQGPVPLEAVLIAEPTAGDATRTSMSQSLDDPVFGGRIQAVQEPLDYRVALDGRISPTYRVSVFEYPRLERADAMLTYPKYTGLADRLVQDFRTLSVVEGTILTLVCRLNKRVATATLTEKGAEPIVLALVDGDHADYQTEFRCEKSRRLKVELVDEAGRANLTKSELSIQVVPNQPPSIKPVFPARDYEVSSLEEMDLKATVFDDFGLQRFGLSYALAGKADVDVVVGENAAAKQKHNLAYKIDFEELGAQPDDLLSYYFWAEDFDRDGKLRRTSSDMYFAEVRHFDEIFRQGQPPPGGQQQQQQQQQGSQSAQAAQQLAQLQKEIMNATWKLIRREIGEQPTKALADDAGEVAKSQNEAHEKAAELAETLQDSASLEHLEIVLESMKQAAAHLASAHDQPSSKPLQPALAAEQAAYQALLKLRAREHEVVRQQQQQASRSQSNSAARSQQQRQQLDQLDLAKEENRYETQRQANSKPEQEADRETRQVLNRLKELARRQHDLNERLKDLQSALQEAESAEKKEEIRQQLKRLEEEQTQVLRDTDELASRMESPENQERMAEERQQLEQTRDLVRRTSEALENEMVTQAAASGTRAEREFDELRNEFRRRASGRFNEQMRDMRDTARDLDRKEKELAERLSPSASSESQESEVDRRAARRQPAGGSKRDMTSTSDDDKKPTTARNPDRAAKSLRDDNPGEQVAQGIAEQRQRLSNLVDRMKETIQEAEQTEPLLTERLYETARNVQDQAVDRILEATGRSLKQGLLDDARLQERAAGKGIEKLREGVERAAEAVLGDEAESLRRAREELQELSRELNREIARNAPDGPQPRDPRGTSPSQRGSNPAAGEQPGESPIGEEGDERAGQNSDGDAGQESQSTQQGRNGQRNPNSKNDRKNADQQRQGRKAAGNQQRGNQQDEAQEGEGQPSDEQSESPQSGDESSEPQQGGQQAGGKKAGGQGKKAGGQNARGQQPGQQSGQQAGQQPGRGQSGGQQPGEGQPGAEEQDGQQPGEGQQGGRQTGRGQNGQRQPGNQRGGGRTGGNPNNGSQWGGAVTPLNGPIDDVPERVAAPIGGNDFLNWSDRLRDVEEMVDDPELRAEAARIRDRARSIRAELKRHSNEPNWDLVRVQVAQPLAELSDRVSEELLRRNSRQAVVPLDRDPVPPKYSEKTRRYYEQLGTGK